MCNGSNGTPDLRNRFVVGAGSTYAVSATGGSKDAVVVTHTHTATSVVTDPGHFHGIDGYATPGGATTGIVRTGEGQSPSTVNTQSKTTGITVATTNASSGVSGTNANLPPYYALAYIMKS